MNSTLPNTGVDYFAYGLHQTNTHDLFPEILDDIMTSGTNVSYEEWQQSTRETMQKWLEDIDITEGEVDINGEIADALCSAGVVFKPLSHRDHLLIAEIRENLNEEGEWDFDAVMGLVFAATEYEGDEDTYTYRDEDDDVELMASTLGGAYLIWVTKSPFVTPCQGCSPCIPGGGDLDSPEPYFPASASRPGKYEPSSRKWAFCLPPKWFEGSDAPCPYKIVHRRGVGMLELGEAVYEYPLSTGFIIPRDDVLHDAVKQRAEDVDHLCPAVKEDIAEQMGFHDNDLQKVFDYLQQDYHARGLSGRYFVLDTLRNGDFDQDDL